MKWFLFLFGCVFWLFFIQNGMAVEKSIVSLEIRSSINPATIDYIKTGLEKAKQSESQLCLIHLDTPGGLLQSTRTIAQMIDQSPIPVVVFVHPAGASATSAGALIMLASHFSAMAPGTNIGAAHPVGAQGEDQKGAMGEKVLNDTAAFARGLAEVRGRNAVLAEKIVSQSQSFTAEEAIKSQLIDSVSETEDSLLKILHGKKIKLAQTEVTLSLDPLPSVNRLEMSLGQKLLDFLANPNIAALLMSLATVLIYVEISTPGFGIAGFLGAICLFVAFVSFQILPIYLGGIALIVIGLGLLIAEAFVVSGGLFAIGGIVSFVLGLLWAVDPSQTDVLIDRRVIFLLAFLVLIIVIGIGFLISRSSQQARLLRKKIGGGGLDGLYGYIGKVQFIDEKSGALGRCKGKVLIRGELWNFVSEESLNVGDEVSVIKTEHLTVVIKKRNKGE